MDGLIIEEAANLNNQAVFALENGALPSACRAFKLALQRVRKDIGNAQQDESELVIPKMNVDTPSRGFKQILPKRLAVQGLSHCCEVPDDDPTSSTLSFKNSRGIHKEPIPIFDIPTSNITSEDYSRLCVTIIFNFAMANHLIAFENKTFPDEAHLQKAARLYELIYRIRYEGNLDFVALISLATLHNLAHIHYCLENKALAEQCCERLLGCVVYLAERHGRWEYFAKFFGSIRQFILMDPSTATAA